ncbi:MAG: MaoC family dehydratase [Pseudomonadota bacterium]
MPVRYLEDLEPGMRYRTGSRTVELAEIQAFATQFDPQPFHLDPEAAKQTLFGELVASGWHTMSLTMRLIVDSEVQLGWGFLGAGVENMDWPTPVLPGDTLHAENEVIEIKPSRSKPDRGLAPHPHHHLQPTRRARADRHRQDHRPEAQSG